MRFRAFLLCVAAMLVGRAARADHNTVLFVLCAVACAGSGMVLVRSKGKKP